MFERFSERARQVVVDAQEDARTLHSGEIDIGHLVLGLLKGEDTIAARALTALDYSRAEILAAADVGAYDWMPGDQIPFTERAKKCLELALREALSLGHNYIGTEHILLGIIRSEWSDEVFAVGDADRLRAEVTLLLGPPKPRRDRRPKPEDRARPREVEEKHAAVAQLRKLLDPDGQNAEFQRALASVAAGIEESMEERLRYIIRDALSVLDTEAEVKRDDCHALAARAILRSGLADTGS